MKKNFLQLIQGAILSILLFVGLNGWGQTTIYSENFAGQNDKGAIGPGGSSPTIDISGVDWTVDLSSADLSAADDWYKVVSEEFSARDVDGDAVWLSPSINISSFSNVSISIDISESGDMESTDFVKCEYNTGSGWTQFATNGYNIDDFTSVVASQTSLSGLSLQIRVTCLNNAGAEYQMFDNILVQGTAGSPIISISSSSLSGFSYLSGNGPSSEQTFTVEGINLSSDITLTPPSDYEISTGTGGSFSATNPITLTQSGGTVASTTIYVRLKAGLSAGIYTEDVIASSTGATDATVTCDGEVLLVDPQVGVVYISEVSDASAYKNEFIELYNNSSDKIDLENCNLQRFSSTGTYEYTWNFPSGAYIPEDGYVVVSRGNDQTTFESEWGALPTGCNFYQGNNNLYFGLGYRWKFVFDDGSKADVIIDDTQGAVATSGNRSVQTSPGVWSSSALANATPGDNSGDGQNLPINLISFTAHNHASGVELKWVTNAEINNDYFTVERSLDGVSYTEVGQVAGAGNSNVELHYNLVDVEQFQQVVYYRLRQTDYDGTFTISQVIEWNPSTAGNQLQLSYVNDHVLHLQVLSSYAQNASVELYALDGRLIQSEQLSLSNGVALYQVKLLKDIQGIYILNIRSASGVITKRVYID
jgi:hypothetical protein